jgi:hypothetical protein
LSGNERETIIMRGFHSSKCVSVLATVLGLLCSTAWAQNGTRYEFGIKSGFGGLGSTRTEDMHATSVPANRIHFGVEACALCEKKYALFGGYDHWLAPTDPYPTYSSADTLSAGFRIQGRHRVRPFADIGFTLAQSRGRSGLAVTQGLYGVGLGFGAQVPIGERKYLRPQLRIYALTHAYRAGGLEVSFGWRFQ